MFGWVNVTTFGAPFGGKLRRRSSEANGVGSPQHVFFYSGALLSSAKALEGGIPRPAGVEANGFVQ